MKIFKKILQRKILKTTLYVGLNDKDSRKQEITQAQAKRIISRILASNNIEGATFLKAEGLYTYLTDNKMEQENTFKIEILFAKSKQIEKAVAQIKEFLNQETVAVTSEKIKSELI